jgi:hypothetical protein
MAASGSARLGPRRPARRALEHTHLRGRGFVDTGRAGLASRPDGPSCDGRGLRRPRGEARDAFGPRTRWGCATEGTGKGRTTGCGSDAPRAAALLAPGLVLRLPGASPPIRLKHCRAALAVGLPRAHALQAPAKPKRLGEHEARGSFAEGRTRPPPSRYGAPGRARDREARTLRHRLARAGSAPHRRGRLLPVSATRRFRRTQTTPHQRAPRELDGKVVGLI